MAKKRYHNGKSAMGVQCSGTDAYPYLAGSWLSFDSSKPAGMPSGVKMVNAEPGDKTGLDIFVPGSKNYMEQVQAQDHAVLKKIVKPSQV